MSSIKCEDLLERLRLDWPDTFIVRLLLPLPLHVDDCTCLSKFVVDILDDVKVDRDDISNESASVVDGHNDAMATRANASIVLSNFLNIIVGVNC